MGDDNGGPSKRLVIRTEGAHGLDEKDGNGQFLCLGDTVQITGTGKYDGAHRLLVQGSVDHLNPF